MEELIRDIQRQWLKAKARAAQATKEMGKIELSAKLTACAMFTGDESLQALVSLMFTPQGTEFLTRVGFPDLEVFRKFAPYHPERYGVYIDAGGFAVSEPRKIFLVGETAALIKCRETAGNSVVLMHGARARIEASRYAVVKVDKDNNSFAEYEAHDHAKILAKK